MLETDVGQLPQQVVEQHEATRRRDARVGVVEPQHMVRQHRPWAARRCRSRSWWRPRPGCGASPNALAASSAPATATTMSPGRTDTRTRSTRSGPVSATAGNARLPMITGCTNSTAMCCACGSHDGAMDHIVAPAANRLAKVNAVAARSAASSAPSPRSIAVVVCHELCLFQRGQHRNRGLTQRQPAVVGRNHVVRQHLESRLLQPLSASAQQQHVLEHPAGEAHQPHRAGNQPTTSATATATARWNPAASTAGGTPARSADTIVRTMPARVDHPVGAHRQPQRRSRVSPTESASTSSSMAAWPS